MDNSGSLETSKHTSIGRQNSNDLNKKQNIKYIIKEFSSKTTAHGCEKILHSNHWFRRSLWTIFLLFAVGGFSVHLWSITIGFLQQDVNTAMDVGQDPYVLPVVTFCSTEVFQKTNLYSANIVIPSINLSANNTLTLGRSYWATVFPNYSTAQLQLLALNSLLQLAVNTPAIVTSSDLVISCRVNGQLCDIIEHMPLLFHPKYGNCILFQTNYSLSTNSGKYNGLDVIIYTGQNDIVGALITSDLQLIEALTGVVYVHENGTYPNFLKPPYNLNSQQELHISNEQNLYNLYEPSTNCLVNRPYISIYINRVKKITKNFLYSQDICRQLKAQQFMIEKCTCYSYSLPLSNTTDLNIVPPCITISMDYFLNTTLNATALLMVQKSQNNAICHQNFLTKAIRLGSETEECIVPCTYLTYDIQPEQSQWPPGDQNTKTVTGFQILKNNFSATWPNTTEYTTNSDVFNFYTAKLAAGQMSYLSRILVDTPDIYGSITFTQTQAYPLIGLLANIGGILGLWVGMSILTIVEFIELVVKVFYVLCCHKCHD